MKMRHYAAFLFQTIIIVYIQVCYAHLNPLKVGRFLCLCIWFIIFNATSRDIMSFCPIKKNDCCHLLNVMLDKLPLAFFSQHHCHVARVFQ